MFKRIIRFSALALGLLPVLATTTGCSSNGVSTSASVHYGVGFYDPWYWNDRHDRPIVVVPPDRPGHRPPRPTPPIGRPPVARPTPLPARPMPRPMPRGRAR